MIKEIIEKYGEFSDSWVSEIKYFKKNMVTMKLNY